MSYVVDNGVLWQFGEDDYFSINDKLWHGEWRAVADRIVELIQIMGAVEIDKRKLTKEQAMLVAAYLPSAYRYDSTPSDHVFTRENGEAS